MPDCKDCIKVIKALGNKTPVGYEVFGWGPHTEEVCHFYVSLETLEDDAGNGPVEVDVIRLCEIPNPQKR